MKYVWRKEEPEYYLPKNEPEIIVVPEFKYLTIRGKGNPNNDDFSNRVEILYALAYAIKMLPKKGFTPEGYFDYTVYPLEGVYDLAVKDKKEFDKDNLIYKLMIRQPDFVDENIFKIVKDIVRLKKKSKEVLELIDHVNYEIIEDGLSVQMMHIGSYDDEIHTFKIMKEFIENNDLQLKSLAHREIYISDPRKTEPNKIKTVIRYRVYKKR